MYKRQWLTVRLSAVAMTLGLAVGVLSALARSYGVTHLLRARRDEPRAPSPERFRLRFESGSLRLYEVAGCPLG